MNRTVSAGGIIQNERVVALNSKATRGGRYVLYWMQASQRTEYNHALEYAIAKANELRTPLLVFFGIADRFPGANERHYRFMLEGLREVEASLHNRGIGMVIRRGSPELGAIELSKEASLVVTDRGYLKIQRDWRMRAAKRIETRLVQVESDVIVPVEVSSPKEEYSAATLRPKLARVLKRFLVPLRQNRPRRPSVGLSVESFDVSDVERALSRLDIDRTVKAAIDLRGGTHEAKKHLDRFLRFKLKSYGKLKNDPTKDVLSNMSPYLHFGQISPAYIAMKVGGSSSAGGRTYLEELIVRRELSINFAFYNPHYDSFEGLANWAQETLRKHESDRREYIYSLEELEQAATHDRYWNAAQLEMIASGKMHGYMRMYWGKKILEWSRTVEDAYRTALYLNDKYELDGRDPNGYAGVAWCFGKHDRPWPERPIFGKVRFMNANGLRRKFDVERYVEKVENLLSQANKRP